VPSVRSRLVSAKLAVEGAHGAQLRQRCELVDDRVGPGGDDRRDDRVAIETVDEDRLRARGAQGVGLRRGAGRGDDVVAGVEEERHEPLADGSGGAGQEDAHLGSPLL
jgi:hypothetical protein